MSQETPPDVTSQSERRPIPRRVLKELQQQTWDWDAMGPQPEIQPAEVQSPEIPTPVVQHEVEVQPEDQSQPTQVKPLAGLDPYEQKYRTLQQSAPTEAPTLPSNEDKGEPAADKPTSRVDRSRGLHAAPLVTPASLLAGGGNDDKIVIPAAAILEYLNDPTAYDIFCGRLPVERFIWLVVCRSELVKAGVPREKWEVGFRTFEAYRRVADPKGVLNVTDPSFWTTAPDYAITENMRKSFRKSLQFEVTSIREWTECDRVEVLKKFAKSQPLLRYSYLAMRHQQLLDVAEPDTQVVAAFKKLFRDLLRVHVQDVEDNQPFWIFIPPGEDAERQFWATPLPHINDQLEIDYNGKLVRPQQPPTPEPTAEDEDEEWEEEADGEPANKPAPRPRLKKTPKKKSAASQAPPRDPTDDDFADDGSQGSAHSQQQRLEKARKGAGGKRIRDRTVATKAKKGRVVIERDDVPEEERNLEPADILDYVVGRNNKPRLRENKLHKQFPWYFSAKGYFYSDTKSILKAKDEDGNYLCTEAEAAGTYDKSRLEWDGIANEGYLTTHTTDGRVRKRKVTAYHQPHNRKNGKFASHYRDLADRHLRGLGRAEIALFALDDYDDVQTKQRMHAKRLKFEAATQAAARIQADYFGRAETIRKKMLQMDEDQAVAEAAWQEKIDFAVQRRKKWRKHTEKAEKECADLKARLETDQKTFTETEKVFTQKIGQLHGENETLKDDVNILEIQVENLANALRTSLGLQDGGQRELPVGWPALIAQGKAKIDEDSGEFQLMRTPDDNPDGGIALDPMDPETERSDFFPPQPSGKKEDDVEI